MSRLPRCVQLRRLLPSASFIGCADVTAESITDRLQDVQPGDLFVARVGPNADGHDFAAEAVARGADAILCERPLPQIDASQCVVASANEAYGVLCQALHGFPSQRVPVIGVTGTDGKTTTCWLLRSILAQPSAGRPPRAVALSGTIDIDDGVHLRPADLTTPSPMALAEWLGRSVGNGVAAAVMELSSHALDQQRAAGIPLDAAIVTTLGRDHLDYHTNEQDYAAAKARIVSAVKPGGRVVLGAPAADAILGKADPKGRQVTIFGDHTAATASVTVREETTRGLKLTLHFGPRAIDVESPLIGRHNADNILAAALAASHLGATPEAIASGVAGVDVVPGRMEPIETFAPFDVFVDYAHTPRGIETVIAAARRITSGRVLVVSGAGGQRDVGKRPLMGQALAAADVVTLTSDNPRGEDPVEICRAVAGGLTNHAAASICIDRAAAIDETIGKAATGDVVLVLGKGHEDTQTIGETVIPFDDRLVCRDAAAKRQPTTSPK